MNLRKKFDRIVFLVEENVEKDSQDISPIIGMDLGISKRMVTQSFSFITSMDFSDYVRGRRLARIIDDIKNQENPGKDVISEIAYKYGYSDRSTFDRAFKKYYKVTPAEVLNSGKPFDEMKKMSLDTVLDSDMEGYMSQERIDEKTTAAVIDDLISSGAMIINLNSEEDRIILNEIMDCQALYGLSTEQVLLAYELSEDKSMAGMSRACEAISIECRELKPAEVDDDLRDCLYLVVNNNLYFDEAAQIVSDNRNGANVDIRRIEKGYLDLVAKYNYFGGEILRNLPYGLYMKTKSDVLEMLNKATGFNITPRPNGTIRARLFYEAESILAQFFSHDEISNPTEEVKQQIDLMFAAMGKTDLYMSRDEAADILNDIKTSGLKDWRECDGLYKDMLFSPISGTISYSNYLSTVKKIKEYGVTDPDDIKAVMLKIADIEWDESFEEAVDRILYKKQLSEKYSICEVDEFEELVNEKFTLEDVCAEYAKSVAKKGVVPWDLFETAMNHLTETAIEKYKRIMCTNGERLTLLIALNSEKSYQEVKYELEKQFEEAGVNFDISDHLYYEINRLLASIFATGEYSPLTFSDYRRICDMISDDEIKKDDKIYFASIAFKSGIYDTKEDSVDMILKTFEKLDNLDENNVIIRAGLCRAFMNDEKLKKRKPHEVGEDYYYRFIC